MEMLGDSPKAPSLPESPRISHSFKRTNSSRQKVVQMESEGNPMTETEDSAKEGIVQVENLSDAKPITSAEFDSIISKLKAFEENEELLIELDFLKIPYLFHSVELLKILELTPSVKTRLSMIASIGPRLIDPTAKATELRETFRFSNEQDQVMKVLKQREKIQAASRFSRPVTKAGPGGMLGGRGGGGGGGRGAGAGGGRGPSSRPSSAAPPICDDAMMSIPVRTVSAPPQLNVSTAGGFDDMKRSVSSSTSTSSSASYRPPPTINTALVNGFSDDGATDVELLSEKSDGSPAELASSCRSSDNGDVIIRTESPQTTSNNHNNNNNNNNSSSNNSSTTDGTDNSIPVRRKSALVIKSRAVTVKTSTQLNEEKMAAAAAALLEPKPAEVKAAPVPKVPSRASTPDIGKGCLKTTSQDSTAAAAGHTHAHGHGHGHVHFGIASKEPSQGFQPSGNNQPRVPSGRKLMDAKGWMKKAQSDDDNSSTYNNNTTKSSSSVVDTPSAPGNRVTVTVTVTVPHLPLTGSSKNDSRGGSDSVVRALFVGPDAADAPGGGGDGIAFGNIPLVTASSLGSSSAEEEEESKSPRDIVRRYSHDPHSRMNRTFSDTASDTFRTLDDGSQIAEGPRTAVDPHRFLKPPAAGTSTGAGAGGAYASGRRNGYSYQPDATPKHSSVMTSAPLTGVISVSELSRAYLSSAMKGSNNNNHNNFSSSSTGVGGIRARDEMTRFKSTGGIQSTPSSSSFPSSSGNGGADGLWSPWTPTSAAAAAAASSSQRPRSNSMDQEELRRAVQKLTDPKMLANMTPEESVGRDDAGNALFTYIELVRRNITKSYGELVQSELEKYMTDAEFAQKMGCTKAEFIALPKWKRESKKKALFLF